MKRVRSYGTIIALALAFAVITAATVAAVNHSARLAACTIFTPAGVAVLGMSLVVMLITGRALARQVRREVDHATPMLERRACPACEREVHGAWRMCPYCGAMVEDQIASKKGEAPA